MPAAFSNLRTPSSRRMRPTSWSNLLTIAGGVPAGANSPFQSTTSTGIPLSASVGQSAGANDGRSAPVSAMTLTLPASTSAAPEDG
jgi:hypothetical protein